MTLPNFVTSFRIILSPFFAVFFFTFERGSGKTVLLLIILWVLFLLIELSDLFDGILARKLNSRSEIGKLLDPFADSVSRLTYFFCFTMSGIMPAFIFFLILYRDLGVGFIRIIMAHRGTAMAARLSGKLKAVIYAAAGLGGLVLITLESTTILTYFGSVFEMIIPFIFYAAGVIAVWSLADYGRALLPK